MPRHVAVGIVVLVGGVLAAPRSALAEQLAPSQPGWRDIAVPDSRPKPTPENIADGKRIYNFRCSPCHGVKGDGEGPVARFLDPRPRDFVLAVFKMRTTTTGELPLDEDLFRTVTRGIPGTAMPSWAPLPAADRWKAIYYLKTFGEDGLFADPDYDPKRTEDGETFLVDVSQPPPRTDELIERGKKAFVDGKCIECHGNNGRGNGTSAGKQSTVKKHRILPRDLTKTWRYKGGSRVRDMWKTMTTGMNGTPMPSSVEAFDTDPNKDAMDRWAVAYYMETLLEDPNIGPKSVLEVKRVGQLPSDPNDPAWDEAPEMRFRMFGQVTRRPRWQTPAVDFMKVRALYDDQEIALRFEYNDRTESRKHTDEDIVDEKTSYPELDVTRYEHDIHTFRDAVAIQFPGKPTGDATKPYFLYGQGDKSVVLWRYLADEDAVAELDAKGAGKIERREGDGAGAVQSAAVYDDGRWRVVMRRSLATDREGKDVAFEPGVYIPFLVMAWDGGSGESGLRQSLSSWFMLRLEAGIPSHAWTFGIIGLILAALLELMLLLRARHHDDETPEPSEQPVVPEGAAEAVS